MAASNKGKTLLHICTIVSTIVIVVITLNIFGVITVPGSSGGGLPLSSGRFDWNYVLTLVVFPVLIFLNLVFWAFTAVSGRTFLNRPAVRQAMQVFYTLLTVALVGILVYRML